MENNEMKRSYKNNIFYKISKFLDGIFNNPGNENVFTAYFNGVNGVYSYIEDGHHRPYEGKTDENKIMHDKKCHTFVANDIYDFVKAIVEYLEFDNYYIIPYKDEYDTDNKFLIDELFLVSHYVEVTVEIENENTKTIHFEIDGVFRFSIESYTYNRLTSTFVFESIYEWMYKYLLILATDMNLYKEVLKARTEDNLVYAMKNACTEDNTGSIDN